MSNSLAIAAVTATLRNLLHAGVTSEPDLADASITMQPLDRARTNDSNANQLNLFLYHVVPSAAWRNQPIPTTVRSGESGFAALGLNLYYLITAFGRDNDLQQPFSHQLMGRAMSVLNDHPVLGASEIKSSVPDNDLWAQMERVRITLQPFAIEEIAKLWTGFQTQYRLSVAYEAAVVLIDSNRQVRTPVPVLMRGPADTGYRAQGNIQSPFPSLDTISAPNGQPTVNLGDVVTLGGFNLGGDTLTVQFANPRLAAPLLIAATAISDNTVTVTLPNKPTQWTAGMYAVSILIQTKGQPDRTTSQLPMALAPKITNPLPIKLALGKAAVSLKITCSPHLVSGQRASLLLGDQEFVADAITANSNQVTFTLPQPAAGTYFLRLRVDGVDSQFIDHAVNPPQFDTKYQVILS